MNKEIDFSVLDLADTETRLLPSTYSSSRAALFFGAFIILVLLNSVIFTFLFAGFTFAFIRWLAALWAALSPIMLVFLYLYITKSTLNAVRIENFATQNNFDWQMSVRGTYLGVLGASSRLIARSSVIKGRYSAGEFAFYNLMNIDFYKTIWPVKSYVVFEMTLDSRFPHIFLDSRHNNRIISNINHMFSKKDEVVLEGDFPKYFRVFSAAPPEDTLRVLSPNFMALLADHSARLDVEIVENKLYMIMDYQVLSADSAKMLYDGSAILKQNLDRYSRLRSTFSNSKLS